MKTAKKSKGAAIDDYLTLVKAFPLRVLRTHREHQDAARVLSRLVGSADTKLSDGARQYADALAHFIEDYDQKKYPVLMTKRSSPEKLKYVMAEIGMTRGDLAKVLGVSQPLSSRLLSGKRNLTTRQMRKLGAHLKIEPGYFL